MTQILKVHDGNPNPRNIAQAAQALDRGELVLCPTETGYCLFGDAQLESTHTRFLRLRQAHPKHKPFSLLCSSIGQVAKCAQLETTVFRAASRVLPGPFTLILPANRHTPLFAAGPKRKTVGIRISNHPVAAHLVEAFEKPVLITSVTDAEEILADHYYDPDDPAADHWWTSPESICAKFKNEISIALSSDEPCPLRVSTVVDFSQSPPQVLRDGGWDLAELGML